jgi:glycosyltransferase involved in cell wall biosynthesis
LNNFFYLRGGSERVLFSEIEMLRDMGHEVAVFSRENRLNDASLYERYFPPAMDTGTSILSLKNLAIMEEILYSRAAKSGLMSVIEDFKPDVAHMHNTYGRLSLSVLDGLKERRIPTVMTLHDYKLLCPSYLMLNHGKICERCRGGRFYYAFMTKCHKDSYGASAIYAFESWLGRRGKKYDFLRALITPSLFLTNKMIEYGWSAERLTHLPNPVAAGPTSSENIHGDYLLYFGRLSPEKGISTLLEALSSLDATVPVYIVGEGPEEARLRSLAKDRGIAASFTGYLTDKALEDAISGAKVVVVPSECYENAPLSILEAFAYAKPVIGSRIGGIPEMIDDGINGFLFEPGNSEDLRSKIEAVVHLLPESTVRQMGMAAREKVEKEYSPKLHYERLIAIYKKAILGIADT